MNFSNISKLVSAGVIAASLSIVPLTAFAQTQDTAPGTENNRSGEVQTADYDNDFDWGWLGLLGLAGLAGLLPKKRQEAVYRSDNDPDVVMRSRSEYR